MKTNSSPGLILAIEKRKPHHPLYSIYEEPNEQFKAELSFVSNAAKARVKTNEIENIKI